MSENKPSPAGPDLESYLKNNPSILPQWLIKLCRPSRMLWLGPLLGFMLSVPFLFIGYLGDDYVLLQNTLDKSAYHHRPVWDYFNWVSSDTETALYRERGILVSWWTPDAFRFHMFRPIASLVHAFEFRCFGDYPWIMHLGLALLYALLIFLCARLLMRFSSSPAALGIAILLFAIDDTHAISSSWISSYNTMLCAVFGLFAFRMHDRWRSQKSITGLLLSITGFLLALLSSEGGLALMGYLFAYALFIESGTWREKTASLIPGLIITIGYLLFYSINNFGAKVSFAYLSPAEDLLNTIFIVLSNTTMLALSQILSFPPLSLILMFSGLEGVIVSVALLAVVIFVFRKFIISNRTVAFFGAGMILTIVPFTVGIGGDRVLLWAGLGAAGLLGELFTVQLATIGKPQRMFAKTLLFTNIVLSLTCFIPLTFLFFSFVKGGIALEKNITAENTVILNNAGAFSSLWSPAIRYKKGGEWPEHCYSLYDGMDTLTIKRTGGRTLMATTANGWFAGYLERSTRPKQLYFNKGDSINLALMTATFAEVTTDKRPLSVSFTFKKDLSEFVWMEWTKAGPQRCKLPEIGGEMKVFAPLF